VSVRGFFRLAAVLAALVAGASLAAPDAAAQAPSPPPADTLSTPAAPPVPVALPANRASWVSDRVVLQVGDILTVLIDEQTAASERVSLSGSAKRSLKFDLEANADGEVAVGSTGIHGGWNGDSKDAGAANREGDFVGTVSVRVTALESGGLARIEGTKKVKVDGREQEITLKGLVRPEDISGSNLIASSRIAEVSISYTGKKIGPKTGIIGKILSFIWS
jgi:flagellar L-ring protein precursor FlgH